MMRKVSIKRPDPSVTWGFRMQGGREFGQPILIASVAPGGLCEQCGLRGGMHIWTIGGDRVDGWTHQQAQQAVIRCANDLEMEVYCPGGVVVIPTPRIQSIANIKLNSPCAQASSSRMKPYSSNVPGISSPSLRRSPVITVTPAEETPSYTVSPRAFRTPSGKPSSNYVTPSSASGSINWSKPSLPSLRSEISATKNAGSDTSSVATDVGGNAVVLPRPKAIATNNKRPFCFKCKKEIHGPFVDIIKHCFCSDHFRCFVCNQLLNEQNFSEHEGQYYCEQHFAECAAPKCNKCHSPIVGRATKALDKQWHPQCFVCGRCGKPLEDTFHVEDADMVLCVKHWNEMHSSTCARCKKPIAEIDRFVEAFGTQYHAACFCCAACQTPLEGKPFHARDNKPFCRAHARAVAVFG